MSQSSRIAGSPIGAVLSMSAKFKKILQESFKHNLEHCGFAFEGKAIGRRILESRIDVVALRTIPKRTAALIECPPDAQIVDLGCHPRYIPLASAELRRLGGPSMTLIDVPMCSFQSNLTGPRPFTVTKYPSIWLMGTRDTKIAAIARQISVSFSGDGEAWFQQFDSKKILLWLLSQEREFTTGAGLAGSPIRLILTAYTLIELGKHHEAGLVLQKLEMDPFPAIADHIQFLRNRLKA